MNETTLTLDVLLTKLIDLEGSDLHLKVGSPPAFRVAGKLVVSDLPSLDAIAAGALADELMPNAVKDTLEQSGEVDMAFGRPSLGRFRANVYRQRGSINITIRSMRTSSYSFEALGLPASLEKVCGADAGLVVVTGGAGSGKTTTLAAMIDYINATRRASILTLEDPIEVLHADKMSLVSQREIGLDTSSFAAGLRSALRQDPDVLFVSDLYEPEAVEAAMHAARTGHLVLVSMLATDVIDAVDRLTEMFSPHEHQRIRRELSATLKAIISLRLMNRADGQGRMPAVEVLVNVDSIPDALAGVTRTRPLRDLIADGAYHGMQSFDQALLKLQQKNLISFQDALTGATDPSDLKMAVQNMGLRSA